MKKIFSVFLFTIIVSNLFAQENLPYSRYGLGMLQPQQFQSTMGMGNLGTAYQSEWLQNPANPASLAALAPKSTMFDVAVQMRWNTLSDGANSSKYFNMQPAYLGLATSIYNHKKMKVGLAFNLLPYSSTAYNFQQPAPANTAGIEKYTFTGLGNTYKFQMASGVKYQNLYVGLQGGYLFGRMQDRMRSFFPDSSNTLGTEVLRIQNPGGFTWQAGLQYVIPAKKEGKLILGLNYYAASNLNNKEDVIWTRFTTYQSVYAGTVDTVIHNTDVKGKMKIPSRISIGAMWQQGRQWSLGAEFAQQDWSGYSNFGNADSMKNSWKLAVGGSFTPDYASTQVFKKCIYKFGFNYGLDPLVLRGKQFNYYSVSGGLSLPLTIKAEENRPMLMFVHLNFETGTHGATTSGLINENFFRVNFGLTFSGNWYQKRKFD